MENSKPFLFMLTILLIQLIPLVVAQDSSTTPTATSSALAQTYTIQVGIDHKFKPEVTQAEAGDLIKFEFFPTNHSVVRAEYEFPCIPYEMTGRGKVGFFSGFRPVDAILPDPPSWTLQINDTDPIFFYCSAPGSCIGYGMVGVINPSANTSLENQRQLAMDSAYMLNPGEPFPPEATLSPLPSVSSTGSSSLASSTTPTSATPTTATSGTDAAMTTSKPVLSKGAIAGIAVGAVTVLALAAALFFFIGRSRTLKQEVNQRSSTTNLPQSPHMWQNHSIFSPKSNMMNESSRNSAVAPPSGSIYQNFGSLNGQGESKAEYYVGAGENGYLRRDTRSPESEFGYAGGRPGRTRQATYALDLWKVC
ncbi:hypothetical protein CC78DRAFT_547197 [Lojkania enalia]|uniref:Extracellular serine-rich protein n=1 Tax=Lojkania enalia TaxID=147567 RepID=A0A9P4K2U9_9PLEO|nr:hypothetical protein CC78DRAFT_547197 [Didymosphaeria enalia]